MNAVRGWTRRDVLRHGAAGLSALALPAASAARAPAAARRCIFILCTGGPSQLETWDPKPDAPRGVRGPFGAIQTTAPGVRISETLPRLARQAHHFALLRSLHHDGGGLHETGLHAWQTGRETGPAPHLGSLVSALSPPEALPPFVALPHLLGCTGSALPNGQCSAFLGDAHRPVEAGPSASADILGCSVEADGDMARACRTAADLSNEAPRYLERYGDGPFGTSCLQARRLVERGARFVLVNQFQTLFHQPTWDCHGLPDLPGTVASIRDTVIAPFDRAVAALLADLHTRGLLSETLVVCVGEMGRSPKINAAGGRDHHTRCFSAMLAGAGIRGGQVVGASDAYAAEPIERPVSPAVLAATTLTALGIDARGSVSSPVGPVPLVEAGAAPLSELL